MCQKNKDRVHFIEKWKQIDRVKKGAMDISVEKIKIQKGSENYVQLIHME